MADKYDVVIAGGGAAGLSAALVLGRARRRVAVVDSGEPRNARAAALHGFLSRDGMAPADLLAAGRREVAGYGVELIEDKVLAAEPGFTVRLAGGRTLETRQLIVTTGLRDELPDIPGLAERWGTDVVVCPYCHGYEVRDQPLGVIASGPMAAMKALLVRNWSADVVLFPGPDPLGEITADERLAARGIEVVPGEIARVVVAGDRLTGVEVGGRFVPRSAIFVNPTFVPADGLLTSLGCETDDEGWVRTDAAGRTSVPGVWAAGNVVDPHSQLITAAGAGSYTAAQLNNELVLGS
ncbi:MAG TPA: NAD(P)/FAD-dependent oxidoreductase [Actinophytocola sp.]|jgi:thioredoxin reductase|uniref:NAD(P)/FAD-dependent oxidoreductase n=1 Tax=Actinophytocola sp. TaxID=1872138 RepID=UPI002F948A1F